MPYPPFLNLFLWGIALGFNFLFVFFGAAFKVILVTFLFCAVLDAFVYLLIRAVHK